MQPFGYTGYRYDDVTQTYFAQAREYKPTVGQFTGEDTHWHPANMIYGDNHQNIGERQNALGVDIGIYMPNIHSIRQCTNHYQYCGNNPPKFIDYTGNDYAMTAGYAGSMWWLTMVDGPVLPFGDIVYGLGAAGCAIVDTVNTIGVDKIVMMATEGADAVKNAANSIGNWFQQTFGGGGSSPPGGPDWESIIKKATKEIEKITAKHGNLKCKQTADAIQKYLTKNDLHGFKIELTDPFQRGIWSNTYNNVISHNGYHVGTYFNGLVYDNIHKMGIPLEQWLNDFSGIGKFVINYYEF
jgi:hypothetical protein